jgi:hypothetical protein
MKKLMFLAIILPILFGCAENEVSNPILKKSVTLRDPTKVPTHVGWEPHSGAGTQSEGYSSF